MVSLVAASYWDSTDDPPPDPPAQGLKTCEWNSSLMSNKLLLSIVFRAFCVAGWIMAVGNCFYEKLSSTNDLLIFAIFLLFRAVSYQWYSRFHKASFDSSQHNGPLGCGWKQMFPFFAATQLNFNGKERSTDNKSFSVVNNWDHLINFDDDVWQTFQTENISKLSFGSRFATISLHILHCTF